MSENVTMNLDLFPSKILSEILTRLPAKDATRFKTVSKRWNYLISHSTVVKSYSSRSTQPWLILDRSIQFTVSVPESVSDGSDSDDDDPKLSIATRFDFVPRPGICTFTVNPFVISEDQPVFNGFPGKVTGSSNGLVVFAFQVMKQSKRPFHRSLSQERNSLFVGNPFTSECAPIPQPEFVPIDMLFGIAIVSRVDPVSGCVDKFIVVEYQHLLKSNSAILQCFSSDTGKWVTKHTKYMLPSQDKHPFRPTWGFEFDRRLFWVELSVGLITWDVKGDIFIDAETEGRAKTRLIPLPDGCARPFTTPEMMMRRSFGGVAGGSGKGLQYVELFNDRRCMLKCWRLKDYRIPGSEWSLVYTVPRVDIAKYLGGGLDFDKFRILGLHPPFDADSGLFCAEETMFSFNFRTKVVEDWANFKEFVECMPVVLPRWPISIPPRLYAMKAKEEGKEYFKEAFFTEAIECYSKSIVLFPTADAYLNRAKAYLKVNSFCEAENDCSQALKIDNSSVDGYVQRAIARKKLGNLVGSKEDADRASKLKQSDQKNMMNLNALMKSLPIPDKKSSAKGAWNLYMVD